MGVATLRLVRRRPRAAAWIAASAVLALAALLIASSVGRATSGDSPYTLPAVVDTNPAPDVVETTIVSQESTVDLGNGRMAHAQTYNGSIPGPTFRLKVGDTVIVHYRNDLTHPSAIHWHGIELSNAMDGTPFTQNQIAPGKEFLYKFKVERPGIFWYHPHHHASTNQVYKGLYGMILVEDPNEAALIADGTLPPASQTKPLVLSDLTVCKAAGANDTQTYPTGAGVPWSGPGGVLNAVQASPWPVTLCETPTAIDEDGNPRAQSFAAGDVPNTQSLATAGRTNEGQTVLTNGMNVGARGGSPGAPGALALGAYTLPVQAGQGLRLPIVNAATTRFMRLRMTTSTGLLVPLIKVGGEGGLLDNAVAEGGVPGGFDTKYSLFEILLPPGTRADVVAAIPFAATGVLTLWTQDYSRTGLGFANIPTVPVMHLDVTGQQNPAYLLGAGTPLRAATGDPVETLGAPAAVLLNPATFVPPKLGLASQNIGLTIQGGAALGIDGVFGTHDVPGDYTNIPKLGSTRYARVGDLLELTVTNVTDAHHPFHLHGFSIQPVRLTRPAFPTYTWPFSEFRDNVDIPARYTLTFRIRLDERALPDGTTPGGASGRWVFHCHIFFHATNGMLGELVVVPASNGNEKPFVNADATKVAVNAGQVASMTGTFKDPEANPVTLSTSLGTVTPGAGGTWSWSHTTSAADSTGLVYVTATDSGGRRDQTVFELRVAQVPVPVAPKLTLAPASDTNPTLTSHTVTAALTGLEQVGGRTIRFTVAGANARSATRVTSAAGVASFAYTGTFAGSDTITACFDANADGDCADAIDLTATAAKRWTFRLTGLDHFKCYEVTPARTRSRAVTLTDQFAKRTSRSGARQALCNPVSRNASRLVNARAHLACYATRDRVRTFRARRVRVANAFGTRTIQVLRPLSLCVPSLKRLGTRRPAGTIPQARLDHFRCYAVKAVAARRTVRLRDQFGTKTTRVVSLTRLCNPVRKVKGRTVAKVRRPRAHLVCYSIRDTTRRRRVTIRNQFETARLSAVRSQTLCLPSLKKTL